jgi:hypothetical protein
VSIDQEFKNIMPMGSYFYYMLQPGSSESFGYLDSLTITLESLIGDADLLVSTRKANPRIEDAQWIHSSNVEGRFD